MNGPRGNDYIAGWSNIYYTSDWASDHGAHNDWAIIVLDRNVGDFTGWCGMEVYNSDSNLLNKTGYAYGYPGTEDLGNSELQWMTSGNISYVDSGRFDINTLFVHGISGGPVFLDTINGMIVGLCKGYYLETDTTDISMCTRITSQMIDIVNSI